MNKSLFERVYKEVMTRDPSSFRDKTECYVFYEAGLFGNRALTWNSYDEIIKSGWTGKVCMRSKKGVDRKKVKYNLSLFEVEDEIKKWVVEGHRESEIGFNQSLPDENLILQGEVTNRDGPLFLLYSTIKKPMNLALNEKQETATGLQTKLILQNSLFSSSYSDLESLLEIFPDSAIEFSSYSVVVGNIPNRNTIIWEVRNY